MNKCIRVNLPCNTAADDRHLFEPFTSYQWEPLKVLNLHEVFITYSGLCVDKNGLRRESHHAYPEKYPQLLNEVRYYYSKATTGEDSLIELDDDNAYLVIHHPWSANYYHWMSESILRVWTAKEYLREMVLLLPEHLKDIEFVLSSLRPFQFKDIYFIPTDKSLLVRNLCLPQIKPICDSYDASALQAIRKHYLSNARLSHNETIAGDRIYISREKAQRRKVKNESEVINLLHQFGFICISTEDYNFSEEISLFSRVRYLISIHGSGLSNMLFMAEGSAVLELHKKKTNKNDWHSFAFWYLADALQLRYYHQICVPTNPESNMFNSDYIVDLDLLEENVRSMIGQSRSK